MATSPDLPRRQDAGAVFKGGYSPWVGEWLADIPGQEFNFPWAPDASFFGGRYHLHASFSAIFGVEAWPVPAGS
jgi:hypothetical protein